MVKPLFLSAANRMLLTTSGTGESRGPEGMALSVSPAGAVSRATTVSDLFHGTRNHAPAGASEAATTSTVRADRERPYGPAEGPAR